MLTIVWGCTMVPVARAVQYSFRIPIETSPVLICRRGAPAPPVFRRGRGGTTLRSRRAPAPHGSAAGEPADPAARGGARGRSARPHDAACPADGTGSHVLQR